MQSESVENNLSKLANDTLVSQKWSVNKMQDISDAELNIGLPVHFLSSDCTELTYLSILMSQPSQPCTTIRDPFNMFLSGTRVRSSGNIAKSTW